MSRDKNSSCDMTRGSYLCMIRNLGDIHVVRCFGLAVPRLLGRSPITEPCQSVRDMYIYSPLSTLRTRAQRLPGLQCGSSKLRLKEHAQAGVDPSLAQDLAIYLGPGATPICNHDLQKSSRSRSDWQRPSLSLPAATPILYCYDSILHTLP